MNRTGFIIACLCTKMPIPHQQIDYLLPATVVKPVFRIMGLLLAALICWVGIGNNQTLAKKRGRKTVSKHSHRKSAYKRSHQSSRRNVRYRAYPRQVEASNSLFEQAHIEGQSRWRPPSFGLPSYISSSLTPGGATTNPGDFHFGLKKGTNLNQWASPYLKALRLTAADLDWIKGVGLDHIRIPLNAWSIWPYSGPANDSLLKQLHQTITWAISKGLKVVVCLHTGQSKSRERTLWQDRQQQLAFEKRWEYLRNELKDYATVNLAYELLGETPVTDLANWNSLMGQLYQNIRLAEPDRWLILGIPTGQPADWLENTIVPEGDPKIILSIQAYDPVFLTQYQQANSGIEFWKGRPRYPGFTFQLPDTANLPAETIALMRANYKLWNGQGIEQTLRMPLTISKKLNLPLYVSSWGCSDKTPMPDRLRWYQDMRKLFELHRIPWANAEYQGSFGLKKADGTPSKELLIVVLDAPIER